MSASELHAENELLSSITSMKAKLLQTQIDVAQLNSVADTVADTQTGGLIKRSPKAKLKRFIRRVCSFESDAKCHLSAT